MTNNIRIRARVLGLAALAAAFVVLPATMASADDVSATAAVAPATVQGGAVSVTCPSGSGTCTRYGANFAIPNSTGAFTIYYTVQWSSTGGSYKVVKTTWVNNTSKTVFFGGFGVHTSQTGYAPLGTGSTSSTYSIGAGSSYSFVESQFGGAGKGLYIAKKTGAYAVSQENVSSWQYHNSSGVTTSGAMLLG